MPLIRRGRKLSREKALAAVPVKNEFVREEDTDGGRILIVPRKKSIPVSIISKIFFMPAEKRLTLDTVGSWVWDRCDGKHTVSGLMRELSEEFKISAKESEMSLMSFLKKLSEKKLIGFLLKER